MTQLILDVGGINLKLPESKKGGYSVEKEDLGVEVKMVSGRITKELRGSVWVLSYQYGYFDDETKNKVIEACEKGRRSSIRCGFLPPSSAESLTYSEFLVSSFKYPKFMWSSSQSGSPKAMWGDFAVELREVRPSD